MEVAMHKVMMSFAVTALIGSLAGCLDGGEDAVSEEASALTVGGHYCVQQSTASAFRTNSPWGPLECSGFATSLPVNTALSYGHPVKVSVNCGNPTYVNVLSLWTGSYYMMRADALTPC
jgi:hypothetical protein